MTTLLNRDFINKKLTWIAYVPDKWDVPRGNYFQLDLKMCQLTALKYNFNWHDDRAPVPRIAQTVDQPSKILHVDVSVNDLIILDFDALMPFRHLRSLDASLNRIEHTLGLEVCTHLRFLNLAHNFIRKIEGISGCVQLYEVHFSMNQIERITNMPTLDFLTILYLDHNQLDSLNGIQALLNLQELYIQKNRLQTLVHLTGCIQLQSINASENRLFDLRETSETLRVLKKLEHLMLLKNPIGGHDQYKRVMVESTTITFLDGENVRPQNINRDATFKENIYNIADVARQAHLDKIETEREKMKEDVRLLQMRIIARQEEFHEYQLKLKKDMESSIQHLGQLPDTFPKVRVLKPDSIEFIDDGENVPLYRESLHDDFFPGQATRHKPRLDYKNIKNPDELLRHAFNELSRGKAKKDSVSNTAR
ncbi:protein phosphatase 1 regulatory subunit pprA-like isoform X2 [Lineus longissimus]|uniref:protein phosphatase 1 regulatory subunit pprA-like isoform X2 n=1 Tax=Lineus longissimus TaxID=88925 RepID=UPI002B4F337F